jgi:predicted outer membrane protein
MSRAVVASMRNFLASPILLAALLLPACSDDNDELRDDAVLEGEAMGNELAALAELEMAGQTPEEMAGISGAILLSIDEGEILLADFVLDVATDPEVLDYAEQMVIEHTGHIAATEDLLFDLGLDPIDNEVSLELDAEAQRVLRELQATDDVDFEYIRSQVVMHSGALILLDSLQATAPYVELQAWIEETLGIVSEHRDDAEDILRDL